MGKDRYQGELKILRKRASKMSDPGSRAHEDTQMRRLGKIYALTQGQCSNCRFLSTRKFGNGLSLSVQLYCTMGHDPARMYENVPFEVPICNDFSDHRS